MRMLPFLLLMITVAPPANAQLLADTTFQWRSYSQIAECGVRIYHRPAEEDRQYTIVLREAAANRGPSTVADVEYLVREIGRRFGVDPAQAYWIFHWGAFSHPGGQGDKSVFLRATFSRSGRLQLSSPRWDVVTREEVEEYTDRHFQ